VLASWAAQRTTMCLANLKCFMGNILNVATKVFNGEYFQCIEVLHREYFIVSYVLTDSYVSRA